MDTTEEDFYSRDWTESAIFPFLRCDPEMLQVVAENLRLFAPTFGLSISDEDKDYNVEAIETAFMASFEVDEGKLYPFRLTFRSEPSEAFNVTEFFSPLTFSVKNISKLAPTLGFEKSILIAVVDQRLSIIGLCEYTSPAIQFSCAKSANLVINMLSKGKTTRLWHITKRGASLPHLIDCPGALQSLGLLGEDAFVLEKRYAKLSELLRRTYDFRRGAIIAIVKSTDWKDLVQPNNPFRLKRADAKNPKSKKAQRPSKKRMENISVLDLSTISRVDGATIIDLDFGLLEFGAKLKAKDSTRQIKTFLSHDTMVHRPSTMKEVTKPISDIGGTRHRSAAQFVYDGNGSVTAIVVSEDGPMTWLFWSDNQVIAIRSAEGLFL